MSARVALLVIGDGRDKLRADTCLSFGANCRGAQESFIVSIDDREHRLGFAGAIREGWRLLRDTPGWDYVFHLEEDWAFDRPFRLDRMIDLLECDPRLAQVALRRNAVNDQERAAGGVVEMWPNDYEDGELHEPTEPPWLFLRHGLYFTTNPCVYPRSLVDSFDWPDQPNSERTFTEVLRSCDRRFALWGPRDGGTWVTHTGERSRGAKGY